jgi:hypothetical protein
MYTAVILADKPGPLLEQIALLEQHFPGINLVVVGTEQTTEFLLPHVLKIEIPQQCNDSFLLNLGLSKCFRDHIIVLDGAYLYNSEVLGKLGKLGNSALLINKNKLIKTPIGIRQHKGKVLQLGYGAYNRFGRLMYLTGKELRLIREVVSKPEKKRIFLFEAINQVIEQGGEFKVL